MCDMATRIDKVESEALNGLSAYGDVFRLMQAQMTDFRAARRQGKPGKARPSFYAEAIGRDRAQFSGGRLWQRIMFAILSDMQEVDDSALTQVGEMLL